MYKALIFDAFGTLIDLSGTSNSTVKQISETINVDMGILFTKMNEHHQHYISTLTTFITEKEIFTLGLKKIYEELNLDRDAATDIESIINDIKSSPKKLYPGVVKTLAKLREKYKIIIASNTDNAPLIKAIEDTQLQIDGYYTSEMLKVYKPNTDFFKRLLERLGYDSSEVIYIGDSQYYDIYGANQAGIEAIWINRLNAPLKEEISPPKMIINSIDELVYAFYKD